MSNENLKLIIEAALMSADRPLNPNDIQQLFVRGEKPTIKEINVLLHEMMDEYEARAFRLYELASGYRFQVKEEYAENIVKLWEEKPAKYTRAYLETLAIIAYRQPITRSEIESIRGVAVSTSIMSTLQEREWVKLVGHRDVPGKPGLYGTTKEFLDYFNLKKLDDLPSLEELKDLDQMASQFEQPQLPLAGLSEEAQQDEATDEMTKLELSADEEAKREGSQTHQGQADASNDITEGESFETDEKPRALEEEQQATEIEALTESEA